MSFIFFYINMEDMQAKIQYFQNSFSFSNLKFKKFELYFFSKIWLNFDWIKIYPRHARFILFSFNVVQLDRKANKVSEKLYFMKKFLYIRKLLSENYQIFGRN